MTAVLMCALSVLGSEAEVDYLEQFGASSVSMRTPPRGSLDRGPGHAATPWLRGPSWPSPCSLSWPGPRAR